MRYVFGDDSSILLRTFWITQRFFLYNNFFLIFVLWCLYRWRASHIAIVYIDVKNITIIISLQLHHGKNLIANGHPLIIYQKHIFLIIQFKIVPHKNLFPIFFKSRSQDIENRVDCV